MFLHIVFMSTRYAVRYYTSDYKYFSVVNAHIFQASDSTVLQFYHPPHLANDHLNFAFENKAPTAAHLHHKPAPPIQV
jgi:hypothetical protein